MVFYVGDQIVVDILVSGVETALIDDFAAGAKTVLYGDYSGLSVNMRENISVEVLREKYATQHAFGVVSWFEFDSKVTDNQKLAVLVQKAA
jgi:HK97 family phage major capsid protein